ncbi:MAG: hypothetical protein NZ895_03215 [Archaeoglobaceae archaeon]|nr:hypothetical protein [Archaeoglobaceae archaeon]MCX8152111.1 hypothetical protein [Archaeoglobaceae archaeon]MDW8013547.1 hypothetical protein [Archaeoglobaceae archaeon]
MEAIKSYKTLIEAPIDLIEEYFKVKQRALEVIFSVKLSKKAHLSFNKEDSESLEMSC